MFRAALLTCAVAAAAIALAGCGAGTQIDSSLTGITRGGKPPTPPTPTASQITFTGAGTLYKCNEDGSAVFTVPNLQGWYRPAWSRTRNADGKFMIAGSTTAGLCVANADGTAARVLVPADAADPNGRYRCAPCWSRDGTEIVYVQAAAADDYRGWLRIVNVATGVVTALPYAAYDPAWSRTTPDRIAFTDPSTLSGRLNALAVLTRTAEGWTKLDVLSNPHILPQYHAWSDRDAGGQEWFAYTVPSTGTQDGALYVAPVDASGLPVIALATQKQAADAAAKCEISWSPEAKRLAYWRAGDSALWVLDVATDSKTLLYSTRKFAARGPDWSPDLTK